MRGDEIGDEILLLACLLRKFFEQLLEPVIGADAGLHHFGKRAGFGVLGRDLEVAADVMRDQLLHIFRRFDGQVIAHPRGDQDFLDAGQATRAPVETDQR